VLTTAAIATRCGKVRVVLARLSALVLASLLSSCAAINPVLKDRTDVLIQDFKSRTPKPVKAAKGPIPMPWEEGQYVVLLSTVDGEPTLTRYAVGNASSDGVWLTIEKLGYRTRERTKVLFKKQPTTVTETRTLVRRMKSRTDENPEQSWDFESDADATVALWKDSLVAPLQILAVVPASGSEAVTVPAGKFKGCVDATIQASMAGSELNFNGKASAAVPINGLVRAFSKRRSATVELVEFGFDGKGSIL